MIIVSSIKAQTFEWVNSIDGTDSRGMAMVTDDEGNVNVTGNVNGISDFDPGLDTARFTS